MHQIKYKELNAKQYKSIWQVMEHLLVISGGVPVGLPVQVEADYFLAGADVAPDGQAEC